MPNWQPNWNNVRWDWGASDTAITSLRRSADKLDQLTNERVRVAREAQREWRGKYREDFDDHLDRLVARARDIANQLRDAANRIASASQRAHEEQRHRENERARWWREKREEEDRARRPNNP
jgi:uncharacterized protein YukE